ncbi:MAG: tartrate-resistant acid phosphatase type 5 [Gaiellales bacterium]|nr:tartrate-resistant acid phosphatase type 5 [Gaiellales bacterium]
MATPADPTPREELLQRRLTRARVALGALGMLVAVCVIGVGVTIWYWISYLLGPGGTPFTRGPYLLRVTGSEAELRWRTRGNKPVRVTALDRNGKAVRVEGGVLRGLAPDNLYTWVASVDGTGEAGGSFTTPPTALARSVRFAVLADYGSGNDDEWAVGRLLTAQRPEFVVTAGDNSYLVAAEVLLDRNIFRPLGDLMRIAPMDVCLGDHDRFFPGPGALSKAFDLPAGGRFTVHHGPIQVVVLGDQPNVPEAVAFARRELKAPGPAVRFVACHRPLHVGDPILPILRESGATVFSGHLHRYERRTVDGVQTFTVGTGGQGPGSLAHTKPTPGADVSLLDIGALVVDVRADGVGYTYLDKSGSVRDHVVI